VERITEEKASLGTAEKSPVTWLVRCRQETDESGEAVMRRRSAERRDFLQKRPRVHAAHDAV
jgi:hypothetical protein